MAVTRDARPIADPFTVTWHGNVRTVKALGVVNMAVTAVDVTTINNVVNLFTVPKGFTIIRVLFDVTRLDNGGAALTLSIGDTGNTARLVSASTAGQSAESQVSPVLPAAALGFRYTADTIISLLVAAAAVTPVAGTITVLLEGYIDA